MKNPRDYIKMFFNIEEPQPIPLVAEEPLELKEFAVFSPSGEYMFNVSAHKGLSSSDESEVVFYRDNLVVASIPKKMAIKLISDQ